MNDEWVPTEPNANRNRRLKRIWRVIPALILVILIVVILVLAYTIMGEKKRLNDEKAAERHDEPPPVNIVVQSIMPETIHDRVNLPGVVEPWVRLQLLSEISGKVVKVSVKEGESVVKGDVLVQIDSRDYKIALDSASASYELAKSDLKRARILFKRELITPAEIDNAETKVTTLKADMDNAKLQLERCTITAPMSGVVNRLDAEVGLLLSVADPVAEILQIDRVKVAVGIPESDVSAVRELAHIDLTIEALNGKKFVGEKLFLASSPDTLAHLYRLELAVDNRGGEILPGMFARADILKKKMTNSVVIPLYAVISRRDERFAYVAEKGEAKIKGVELGILDGWRVQVLKGLKPGDQVIVVGQRDVDDGQKVNVINTVMNSRELAR
jgi:membrane fusion protein (multidrug efflux system)